MVQKKKFFSNKKSNIQVGVTEYSQRGVGVPRAYVRGSKDFIEQGEKLLQGIIANIVDVPLVYTVDVNIAEVYWTIGHAHGLVSKCFAISKVITCSDRPGALYYRVADFQHNGAGSLVDTHTEWL